MKILLLMRHGEAENRLPVGLRDFQRPLSAKGRRDAVWVGRYLAQSEAVPEHLVASSALRTRSTAELIAQQLALDKNVATVTALYNGAPEAYLEQVWQLPATVDRVLMIGHNPAVSALADAVRGTGTPVGNFHPGAVACLGFDVSSWDQVQYHKGYCRWFVKPGDQR